MRIGIDIDGVLTNFERWMIEYITKFACENNIEGIKNINAYTSDEIFGWSEEIDDKFWDKYLIHYATNEKARAFSGEIIQKLKNEGNEIYIITARYLTDTDSEEGENMRNIVFNWLKENNINYDKLIFSGEDKRRVCKDNKIDIMIEDSPKNIKELSKIVPNIICFDAQYNKECNGENIIRCYSWYDIYSKINKM